MENKRQDNCRKTLTQAVTKRMRSSIFRSRGNAHRFYFFIDGKLRSFLTHEKDFLADLAYLFGNLNSCVATRGASFVRVALPVSLLSLFLSTAPAFSLPTNPNNETGISSVTSTSTTMTVTANANRSVIHFDTFNIGAGEAVTETLPSAASAILNKVDGATPSQIFGALNSNGQVFLVNPNGVLFAPGAQVNVGSLFATTLNISDTDFLNGNLTFKAVPGTPGSVDNQGDITAADSGYVVLAGAEVSNSGNITAPNGQVHLDVGDQITMVTNGGIMADVTVDNALQEKVALATEAISNTGTISAPGGVIKLNAQLAQNIYSHAINNSGVVEATGYENNNGTIEFVAHADSNDGLIINSGTVDVSGNSSSHGAGSINIEGDQVNQTGDLLATSLGSHNGSIDVSATQGDLVAGGNISVNHSGSITLSTTGNNGNINLSGTIGGATTTISADGSGNITQSSGKITGSKANFVSGSGDIGTHSSNINVTASTVTANTSGNAYLSSTGSLTVGASTVGSSFDVKAKSQLTTNGDVTANDLSLTSTTNNVKIDSTVTGTDTLNVTAHKNIYGTGEAAGSNVNLTASTGNIGLTTTAAQAFTTNADNLTANAPNGTVNIHQLKDVNLGASSAGNDFEMLADGNVNTTDVVSGSNVSFTATGGNSLDFGADVNATNNISATVSGAGNISGAGTLNADTGTLTADTGSITVNTHFNSMDLNANGNIDLIQAGSITLTGGSSSTLFEVTTTDNGNITYTGDISAPVIDLTAGGSGAIVRDNSAILNGSSINLASGTGSIGNAFTPILVNDGFGGVVTVNTAGNAYLTSVGDIGLGDSTVGGALYLTTMFDGSVSVVGNVDPSLISIKTDGLGSITDGGGVLEADTVKLLTEFGSIGTAGDAVHVSATNLYANAGGSGSAYLVQQGKDVNLGTSSAGFIFSLESTGDHSINIDSNLSASQIYLTADGAGNITDSGSALIASQVALTSGTGSIGASGNAIYVTGASILSANTSGSGNVYLFQDGEVNLKTSSAGNIFSLSTSNDGDINIKGGILHSGEIDLSADGVGNINDVYGTLNSTGAVNLSSGFGNIGSSSSYIQTNAGALSVNTGGSGSAYVHEADDITVNDSSVAKTFDLKADGNITFNGNTTAKILSVRSIHGDIGVYSTVDGTSKATLRAHGDIYGSGEVDGDHVSLTSDRGDIGGEYDPLYTSANNLTASATQGSINIFQDGTVSLGRVKAKNYIDIGVFDGTMNVNGLVTGNDINLFTVVSGDINLNKDVTAQNNLSVEDYSGGNISGSGLLTGQDVSLSSFGGDIIVNTKAGSYLDANTDGSGNVSISQDGSVTLGDSSAGNAFDLTVNNGSLNLDGNIDPNTVELDVVGGSITHTSGTISAENVILNADGSIGAVGPGNDVQTNTANLTVHAGTDASDNVYLTNTGDVDLHASSAGGEFSLTTNDLDQQNLGDIAIDGGVTASQIDFSANNNITEIGGTLDAGKVNLASAAGNIGASDANVLTQTGDLSIDAENGSAYVSNTGDVNLNTSSALDTLAVTDDSNIAVNGDVSANTVDLTAGSISENTGTLTASDINLTTTTGDVGSADAYLQTAADGSMDVESAGGSYVNNTGNVDLTVNSVGDSYFTNSGDVHLEAASEGINSIFSLETTNSGSIFIEGDVDRPVIKLVADGSIVEGGSGLLNGTTVDLTSNTGSIGASDANVQTQTSNLSANASEGNVYVTNSGDVSLNASQANGEFSLTDDSNIALSGNVSGTQVDLTAGGSITDDPVTITGTTVNLTATTGDLGSSDANILTVAGNLSVHASGNAYVTNSGDVNLDGSSVGSELYLTDDTNVAVDGNVNAGKIDLTAGSISETTGTLAAGTVNLDSTTGSIGSSSSRVQTSADELSVSSAGDAYLNEYNGVTVNTSSAAGTLDLIAGGTTIFAGDTTANILNVKTTNGGDLVVNSVLTGTDSATLESANDIYGSGEVGGDNVSLQAGGWYGNIYQTKTAHSEWWGTYYSEDGYFHTSATNLAASTGTYGFLSIYQDRDVTLNTIKAGQDANLIVNGSVNVDGGITAGYEVNLATTAGDNHDIHVNSDIKTSNPYYSAVNLSAGYSYVRDGYSWYLPANNSAIDGSGLISSDYVNLDTLGGNVNANTNANYLSAQISKGSGSADINQLGSVYLEYSFTGDKFALATQNGDISIDYQVSAPNLIQLTANGGSIKNIVHNDYGYTYTGLLYTNNTVLTADGSIGSSDSNVLTRNYNSSNPNNITANAGSGSVYITNTGNVNLEDSSAAGEFSLKSNESWSYWIWNSNDGNIAVDGNVTAGQIDLTAYNGISETSGTLTAPDINLTAQNGNIGSSDSNMQTAADDAMTLNASGSSYVNNTGNVDLTITDGGESYFTNSGDVTLEASNAGSGSEFSLTTTDGGNIDINGNVSAGQIDLTADGAITDDPGTLIANTVNLTSNTGTIGTWGADVLTETSNLSANAPEGDVYITNSGDVNLNASQANGTFSLTDDSNVAVNGNVNANEIDLTGGSISENTGTLTAPDIYLSSTSGDIGSSDSYIQTAADDYMDVESAGSSYVNNTGDVDLNINANGDSYFTNAGDVSLEYSNAGGEFSLITSNGGTIWLEDDVNASQIDLTADGAILEDAGGTLYADTVNLTTHNGDIGTSDDAIQTGANTSMDVESAGNAYVNNGGSIDLTIHAQGESYFTNDGDVTLEASSAGANSEFSLSTFDDGNVDINGNVSAGQIDLTADGSITDDPGTLIASTVNLTSNTGSIGASDANVLTETSNLSANASEGDVYVTNSGAVNLNASQANGEFSLTDDSNVAVNGDVDASEIDLTGGSISETSGTLTALDINLTSTSGDIGSSDSYIQTAAGDAVTVRASGSSYVNNTGSIDLTITDGGESYFTNDGDVTLEASNAGTNSEFSLITSDGGNVEINGDVDAGQIDLTADGSITDDPGTLIASTVNLTSNTGSIGASDANVLTETSNLSANASEGDVYVTNSGDVNLNASQASGEFFLTDDSNVAVNGDVNASEIDLTAGSISETTGTLTAPDINLTSTSGDIGSSDAYIQTAADDAVTVSTSGSSYVNNTGSIDLTITDGGDSYFTNDGDVTLEASSTGANSEFSLITSDGGNIAINGDVNAGQIDLTADGSITDDPGTLIAGTVNLTSNTGSIGASDANVLTETSNLSADASEGDVYVSNSGDVNLSASQANGTFSLTDNSNIAVNGDVNANEIDLTGGSISESTGTLTAPDIYLAATSGDIGSGDSYIQTAADDFMNIESAGSSYVNNNGDGLDLAIFAQGDSYFTNSGDVYLEASGAYNEFSLTTSNKGNIYLEGDVLTLNNQIDLTADGSIIEDSQSVLFANTVNLTANTGSIGDGEYNILTATSNLSANAPDGDVYITNLIRDLNLDASSSGGEFSLTNTSDVSFLDNNSHGPLEFVAYMTLGNSLFDSNSASVAINGNVSASQIDLTADGNITDDSGTLIASTVNLTSNTGSIGASDANVLTETSNLSANASEGDVYVTNSGDVNLNASQASGTFSLTDDSNIAVNGDVNASEIDLTAGSISETTGTLTAPDINLTSTSGDIGTSDAYIQTAADDAVTLDASGRSYVNNTGNIDLTVTDGGDSYFTNDGDVTLEASNAGANSEFSLITSDGGNVDINGNVSAGQIDLTADGGITDDPGTLIAGTVNLTSNTGSIGASDANVLTETSNLSANASEGDVYVTNSGDLNLNDSQANGTFSLTDDSNIAVNGDVNASEIDLTAGSISETTGTLTAPDIYLTSNSGDIGSSDAYIQTAADEYINVESAGSSYINNTGNIDLNISANGDSYFTNNGDVYLDYSEVGGEFSLATSNDGNIWLEDDVYAGQIDLTADGSILQDSAGTLYADTVNLTANNGSIGDSKDSVSTETSNLSGNAPNGDVYIDNSSDVNLNASQANGTFSLTDDSNVAVNGNVNANEIDLTAGSISENSGTLTAPDIYLTSHSGDIGSSDSYIQTAADDYMSITSAASSYVNNVGNVDLSISDYNYSGSSYFTNSGDVYLEASGAPYEFSLTTSNGGNIYLEGDVLTLNDQIDLTADGSIVEDSQSVLFANTVNLTANTGSIGDGEGNILTATSNLSANAPEGDVYITNLIRDLNLDASSAGGEFSLTNTSDVSFLDDSHSELEFVAYMTLGNSLFDSNSASIAINGNVSASQIDLSADQDITETSGTLTANTVDLYTNWGDIGSSDSYIQTAAQNMDIESGGSSYVSNTGNVDLTISDYGDSYFTNNGDVTIEESSVGGEEGGGLFSLQTSNNGSIAINGDINWSESPASDIELTADGSGNITDANGSTLHADTVGLYSGSGNIGTSDNNIETDANFLTANTSVDGSGNVYVTNQGTITLVNKSASGGVFEVTTLNNGSVFINGGVDPNTIILNANGSGNITWLSGLLAANQVELNSGSGNIGDNGANILTKADTLTANTSGTGHVYINQTGNVDVGQSQAGSEFNLTANGNITTTGTVTAHDLTFTTSNNGSITFGANANATNITTLTANGTGNIISNGGIVGGTSLFLSSGSGDINLVSNVQNISGSTTGNFRDENLNALTIGLGGVSGNNVFVFNDNGDLTLKGLSSGTNVALESLNGNVLNGNGGVAPESLLATNSGFIGAKGIIGTLNDPIGVIVQNGPMLISSYGETSDGISVVLNGIVNPSGRLELVNFPPGEVLFNGQLVFDMHKTFSDQGVGTYLANYYANSNNSDAGLVTASSLQNVSGTIANLNEYIPQAFNLMLLQLEPSSTNSTDNSKDQH